MSNLVVAIGGTGQMVLFHYLQWYLLGVVREPFRAVVIDTDAYIDGLLTIRQFLKWLPIATSPDTTIGATIPTLDLLELTDRPKGTVAKALTDQEEPEVARQHPARAFFDRGTLNLSMRDGMFARPALSAIVSTAALAAESLRPLEGDRVVFVGSLFGGTGGGLLAPVADAVRMRIRESQVNVQTRGVFFGTYFQPDENRLVDARRLFRSNQLLVLRSLAEAVPELHSYCVVGGSDDNTNVRDPDQERHGRNQPWTHGSPYWKGAQALHHLLVESLASQEPAFASREVPLEAAASQPEYAVAQQTLAESVSRTAAFVRRKPLNAMAADPSAGVIWGDPFCRLVAGLCGVARQANSRFERWRSFLAETSAEMGRFWNGGRKDWPEGLQHLFPTLGSHHSVGPSHLRTVNWPALDAQRVATSAWAGASTAAEKAAAMLIFRVLRG
jgi:hypothetical protein